MPYSLLIANKRENKKLNTKTIVPLAKRDGNAEPQRCGGSFVKRYVYFNSLARWALPLNYKKEGE